MGADIMTIPISGLDFHFTVSNVNTSLLPFPAPSTHPGVHVTDQPPLSCHGPSGGV